VRRVARRLDRHALRIEARGEFARARERRDFADDQPLEMRKQIHHVVA